MTLLTSPLLDLLRAGPEEAEHEHVLDAALAAFMDFGIRRTTMGEIARRSGVSPATLYRRFPGKDQLVWAVGRREAARFVAGVDAAVDREADAESQLVELFMGFVRGLRQNRLLPRLMATEPEVVLPFLTTQGAPVLVLGRAYLAEVIRRLQADGHLPVVDPEPAAEMVARVALSLALTPQTCIPLDDDEAARHFARQHVAILFGPGRTELTR
ncbi:MAG TPA: TetR/AcrR family transcriptional regulator [Acidimicrobiales bacterium]